MLIYFSLSLYFAHWKFCLCLLISYLCSTPQTIYFWCFLTEAWRKFWIVFLWSFFGLSEQYKNRVLVKNREPFTDYWSRCFVFFSFQSFCFTDTVNSQDCRGREAIIFILFPPAHEHSDIYLQLCMLDDHHIFLIASLHIVTKLLLDEIYHLRKVTFEGLSVECWFQHRLFPQYYKRTD